MKKTTRQPAQGHRPGRWVLGGSALLIGVCGFFYLQDSPDATLIAGQTQETASKTAISAENTQAAPAPVVPEKKVAATDPAYEDNPYFEEEVKARLAQVADAYAEQIQYPTTSMPIPDRQVLEKYQPNRSFEASLPLDSDDPDSPTFALKTDKVRYFTGETVLATITVNGLDESAWVEAGGRLVDLGNVLQEAEAQQSGEDPLTFQMSFDLSQMTAEPSGEQLRVAASLNIDGNQYEIGSPITYVDSVAKITHVDVAQVQGEYLEIPVHINTTRPGYHELGANLYSAETGEPLVHLTAQDMVRSGQGIIPLKAHISALKSRGSEGPYALKDLLLTRMPSEPDYTTEYGRSANESYAVEGYPFDQYDDVPYVDEEARERLAFLRQLGTTE